MRHLLKTRRGAAFLGMVVLLGSCSLPQTGTSDAASKQQGSGDYFPFQKGARWKYSISIGEVEPLYYRVLNCGELALEFRSRFGGLLSESAGKKYELELRIKDRVANQGPLHEPEGVELEVMKDDLGIFPDSKQMFWAIRQTPVGRTVFEVLTYEPGGGGCAHLPGPHTTEASAQRMIYFDKPGNRVQPEGRIDSMESFDPVPDGFKLVRSIPANTTKDTSATSADHLAEGWTDELWFEAGRGMVRLTQRFGGKVSMRWDLIEFAPTEGTLTK